MPPGPFLCPPGNKQGLNGPGPWFESVHKGRELPFVPITSVP